MINQLPSDKTISCRDCGASFEFTKGEQEFYQTKGFNEPARCKQCRAIKKAQSEQTERTLYR